MHLSCLRYVICYQKSHFKTKCKVNLNRTKRTCIKGDKALIVKKYFVVNFTHCYSFFGCLDELSLRDDRKNYFNYVFFFFLFFYFNFFILIIFIYFCLICFLFFFYSIYFLLVNINNFNITL